MAFTYYYSGIPQGGRYTKKVSVQADTTEEAISAVRRLHGISNPTFHGTSCGDDGESETSWGEIGGGFAFLGIIIVIGLILPLLPYIIGFGAIGLVCWGGYKLIKWMWNYK